MAHMIDFSTGAAAVFVTGEPAWHKLGRVISQAATSAEAIELARLNWIVEQWPLFLQDGRKVKDRVANVRSDTQAVLGVVSTRYEPFQNAEAFEFMDSIVGERLAMFETAGSLNEGRNVWMMARIPKTLRVAGADEINPYILLSNGHDGTKALRMIPTSVRVVCQNTLNLAMGGVSSAEDFRLNHSKSLKGRVEEARSKLGVIVERFDTFQAQLQALAAKSLPETEAKNYFETIFPVKRPQSKAVVPVDSTGLLDSILDQMADRSAIGRDLAEAANASEDRETKKNTAILEMVLENYHNRRNSMPEIQGTAWAAYNAVSEYVDHQAPVRGRGERGRAESRLNSIWFGQGDKIKQTAFSAALQLAV